MAFNLVPAGTILPFGGALAPSGWLLCEGTSVSQSAYPALSAAIGTAWGNPGGGSFNLPDMRGRFPRGRANGSSNDPDRAARTSINSGGNTGDNVGSGQGVATKTPTTDFSTSAKSLASGTTSAQSLASGTTLAQSLSGGTAAADASSRHWHQIIDANNTNYGGLAAFGAPNGAQGMLVSLAVAAVTAYAGNNHNSVDSAHSHGVTGTCPASTVTGTCPASTITGGDNETRPINANVNYIIKF